MCRIFSKDCGSDRAFTGDEGQYYKPPKGSLPLQHMALFVRCIPAVKGLERTPDLFSSSCNSSNVIDILSVKICNIKVQVIYNGCLKKALSLELKSLNVSQRTRFLLNRYTFERKKRRQKKTPIICYKG